MPSEHSEQNPHSRNLKIISLFFIFYWVLGLAPSDESIRFAIKSYEISNGWALKWISYSLLFYFSWRFYLNSGKRLSRGIRLETKVKSLPNNINRSGRLYGRLLSDAEAHYVANVKEDFENIRQEKQNISRVSDFSNNTYEISISSLGCGVNKSLSMKYHVVYKGGRLPENDFSGGHVKYRWFDLIPLRILGFLRFFIFTEEGPDYLLPWLLLALAIVCAFLIHFGVDAADVMDIFPL